MSRIVFRGFGSHRSGGSVVDRGGDTFACGAVAGEGTKGVTDPLGEELVGGREPGLLGEAGRELPETGGGVAAGCGRPRDNGEFEHVSLEVPVEAGVVGLSADGLVTAEGLDRLDGGIGRFGACEEIEPPGDKGVGREDS